MNDLLKAAALLCESLRALQLPFCLIGGVALQRWSEPRMTVDLDVTLLAGFGNEREVLRSLQKTLQPRIDDFIEFGMRNRIALLQTDDGIGVDISLGALPYEERVTKRSSKVQAR